MTPGSPRQWLQRYLPLVEEGTWAWLEIGESTPMRDSLPAGVVASVFANRDLHLVLANYATTPAGVVTADEFTGVAQGAPAPPRKSWSLPGRSLRILRWQLAADA